MLEQRAGRPEGADTATKGLGWVHGWRALAIVLRRCIVVLNLLL